MKFLLFLLFASPAIANTVFQSAVHQAKWETEASALACALHHDVTDYGHVSFHRHNGEAIKLTITT